MQTLCFRDRAAAYRRLIVSCVASFGPVHLLTGMSGNVGDQLIWAGTRDLLDDEGIGFEPVDVSAVETIDRRDGVLVVPGSGAHTLLWHGWLPQLVLGASERFSAVIVLPSQFDATVGVVREALARPNVHAFAREARSYEQIREFGRAAVAFDCAVYARCLQGGAFGGREPWPLPAPERTRRLVALREDEGSMLARHGVAVDPRFNRDISRTAAGLEEFLTAVDAADFVITDRLHVAVTAVMSGRFVRYLDPFDRKISTYLDFTFRDEIRGRAEPCSVAWLVEQSAVVAGV
ncbi:MAG: polysaccharide pyruvyl transferase family protein [Planctomycetia bacterium]